MRSLSYIIILMSLIGNCQSEKISCVQNIIKSCESAKDQSVSKTEANQWLKEFNHFVLKYHQKYKKQQPVFAELNLVYTSNSQKQDFLVFDNLFFDEVSKLQKKTSKIRNKDDLEIRIAI